MMTMMPVAMESPRTAERPPAPVPPEYLVSANERQYLAKLCWLLHDAGTHALRTTFDSVHPRLYLRQHLAQHHVRAVLRKLLEQKVLTDKQWTLLYPTKKTETSSDTYDAQLLLLLLQSICHLSPPYPHGWGSLPQPGDFSLSADVVRLQMYFQQAGGLGGVRSEEYPVMWKQIVQVLLRTGAPEVRAKIAHIDEETLSPEHQAHFINLVKAAWAAPEDGALGRLRRLGAGQGRSAGLGQGRENGVSRRRRQKDSAVLEAEGISAEDRIILSKVHRQLTEAVMAEDVVDRLVQGRVIKANDRQDVMTSSKNQERMQILLSKILQSKLPDAFKLFCDVLSVKYPKLHETVVNIRRTVPKEAGKDTRDIMSVIQQGLANKYRAMLSRTTPLPWSDVSASVPDVYVPLEVVTQEGANLQLYQILPVAVTSGRGKRVLLEGESGSGKTFLAAMLAYQWASDATYFTSHFSFLLLLDARAVDGSLAKAVHSQVENLKLITEDIWSIFEQNAREVVVIVDNYDEDHSTEELRQVVLGNKLRHATVMVTSCPGASAERWSTMDYKLFLLGLNPLNTGRCLKTFAVLSKITSEEYDAFYEAVTSQQFKLQKHLRNPYVCLAVFGVHAISGKGPILSVDTLTGLYEQFLVALATRFCRKPDSKMSDNEFPSEILSAISILQSLAYRSLINKEKLMTEGDLHQVVKLLRAAAEKRDAAVANGWSGDENNALDEDENRTGAVLNEGKESSDSLLRRCGMLHSVSAGRWSFACSTLRDFLAARHLSDTPFKSLDQVLEERKTLRHSRFAQMSAFLCGLFRDEGEVPLLSALVKDMTLQAAAKTRRVSFGSKASSEIEATSNGVDDDGPNGADGFQVMHYAPTLQALPECSRREDLTGSLVRTLPSSFLVQGDGFVPGTCLAGLALAVKDARSSVAHVEVELLPYHSFQSDELLSLAEALSANPHLQTLTIRWQNFPLMVNFLKACLTNAPQLASVVVQDASRKPVDQVAASTWVTLHELGSLLRNTRSFSFVDCKAAVVVSQLIPYLPDAIPSLDFSGSIINMISTAALGSKLESSQHCCLLNLSETHLESSDLSVLFHDLKLCASLTDLILAGNRLDRSGAKALSEYLKLTTSLQRLDLGRCHLTNDVCQLLADGMSQNTSLSALVVTDAHVTREGKELLRKARKGRELLISGL